MKVKEFPQANATLGDDKDQVPVFKHRNGTVITCFEISDEDIKKFKEKKELWLVVETYNEPIQPVMIQMRSPFDSPEETKNNDK